MGQKPEAHKATERDTPITGGGMDRAVRDWKETQFAQLTAFFKKKGWGKRIKITTSADDY